MKIYQTVCRTETHQKPCRFPFKHDGRVYETCSEFKNKCSAKALATSSLNIDTCDSNCEG